MTCDRIEPHRTPEEATSGITLRTKAMRLPLSRPAESPHDPATEREAADIRGQSATRRV